MSRARTDSRSCPRYVSLRTTQVSAAISYLLPRYRQGMIDLIIKDSEKSLDDLL